MAELEEKEHPKDPSAVAAILFKMGDLRFNYSQDQGFVMYLEVKTRIKIYKKEGYDWANFLVNYYDYGQSKEGLQISDAATYNLVNGKIEKTKLKGDGEFIEKINKYLSRKKITMPNVKENCIVEFSYILESPNISEMRDWVFQYSIPVNYSEFKTNIPEYLVYRPNQKGYVFPEITTEKNERTIKFRYTDKASVQSSGSLLPTYSTEEADFIENTTIYHAKNLPAMHEEAYVNNIDNYTSSISHELAMTKYPNSLVKTYSTDWESVVKTIYDYEDFGPELNKTGYFENDINKLLTGIDIQNERIVAIFNFVKSNIKWNNSKGYSCNDGVKKAYSSKTGNTAEINLMLTAMLRFAGVNANPVLISTRDNGISFFPSRTAFNAVITGVETADGIVLLDATEKNAQPNILPLRDINWNGRLIRKDGTSIQVDLVPKAYSNEMIIINSTVQNDGVTTGKLGKQVSNQIALNFRNQNLALSEDSYLEKLEKEFNNLEINDYKRENDFDLSKPILESYSFKDIKCVEIINEKMYISPLLFLTVKENPFKQDVREYPIDFGFPISDRYTINIQIPEGYTVESMPENINISTVDDLGSFKYISANNGNVIQSVITSTVNAAIVPANYYADLKNFYQAMIDKQNEKIVLKKI